jgi:hypothetical protein
VHQLIYYDLKKGSLMEKINQATFQKPIGDFPTQDLSIVVTSNLIPFFFQLLGQGFMVNAPTNCSARELIRDQLGIPDDYLEERIQTLFLNGSVVDDLNSCIINEDSTLALSGAMPGLAGATLRRGGFYASFRSQISYDENQTRVDEGNHWVVLKLFNLIVKELGPAFLEKGILMEGEKLQKFLIRNLEELRMSGSLCEFNGKPVDINRLQKVDWKSYLVFLQVKSKENR